MSRVPLCACFAAIGCCAALSVAAQPASADAASVAASAAARTDTLSSAQRRSWESRHRLSRVIGTEVRNRSGQKIGDLRDLVVDGQGKVTLAIVSTGGFLGLGDRLHAVPWEVLRSGSDGERVLDMEKAQLSRVPGFDERNWPDLGNQLWVLENRRHFGL